MWGSRTEDFVSIIRICLCIFIIYIYCNKKMHWWNNVTCIAWLFWNIWLNFMKAHVFLWTRLFIFCFCGCVILKFNDGGTCHFSCCTSILDIGMLACDGMCKCAFMLPAMECQFCRVWNPAAEVWIWMTLTMTLGFAQNDISWFIPTLLESLKQIEPFLVLTEDMYERAVTFEGPDFHSEARNVHTFSFKRPMEC